MINPMFIPKIKITPKKLIHISYLLIILLAICVISASSIFLYNNFYLAITQSEEVIKLRKEVAFEALNVKKFDDIISKIEKKTASITASSTSEMIENIFD